MGEYQELRIKASAVADWKGVPEGLFFSLIKQESGWQKDAIRYERGFSEYWHPDRYAGPGLTKETEIVCQQISWGLCQILGATARRLSFRGRYLTELLDPNVNLVLGARYLVIHYQYYGDWEAAVAAYNHGYAKKDLCGYWVNQAYVDAVMSGWTAR